MAPTLFDWGHYGKKTGHWQSDEVTTWRAPNAIRHSRLAASIVGT